MQFGEHRGKKARVRLDEPHFFGHEHTLEAGGKGGEPPRLHLPEPVGRDAKFVAAAKRRKRLRGAFDEMGVLGKRLKKGAPRRVPARAEAVGFVHVADDVADVGVIEFVKAGAKFGKMYLRQPECDPVVGGKLPAVGDGALVRLHARGAEGGAEGALFVLVKVDDGMIGVKNEIVVRAHQSCLFKDLSLMSS